MGWYTTRGGGRSMTMGVAYTRGGGGRFERSTRPYTPGVISPSMVTPILTCPALASGAPKANAKTSRAARQIERLIITPVVQPLAWRYDGFDYALGARGIHEGDARFSVIRELKHARPTVPNEMHGGVE